MTETQMHLHIVFIIELCICLFFNEHKSLKFDKEHQQFDHFYTKMLLHHNMGYV